MIDSASNPRNPQFKVSDPVIVVGPGVSLDKAGFVMEVIKPTTGDFVYRYRVRFTDGASATFFGFELNIHP